MTIVLRPDGDNSDVLKPAGKVHLSSTVFSSYPAWIYPVRSSCSKYQRQRENRLLAKWEESDQINEMKAATKPDIRWSQFVLNRSTALGSKYWSCLLYSTAWKNTWNHLSCFLSYLQLVISISVNNHRESTSALHLLFLCELDQSGLLAPSLPQLPGRIFFNQWK